MKGHSLRNSSSHSTLLVRVIYYTSSGSNEEVELPRCAHHLAKGRFIAVVRNVAPD